MFYNEGDEVELCSNRHEVGCNKCSTMRENEVELCSNRWVAINVLQ